jgi:hypothetical protein
LLESALEYADISSVSANRIDAQKVKVSWGLRTSVRTEGDIEQLYDSYIVMKVANGVRRYLGKTHMTHIYHYLSPEDIGSIYYIVVPVTSDMSLDRHEYSNILTIGTDRILQSTPQENYVVEPVIA